MQYGLKCCLNRRGALLVAVAILLSAGGEIAPRAQPSTSEGDMIIYHLNVAIDWYQRLASANESAGQASDTFYFDNARSLSKQAIQLAFESAEAEAELLAAAKTGGAPGAPLAGSEEAEAQSKLAAAAANAADHLKQVQTQIDEVDKQLPRVSGKKRQELTLQRENLQAELALDEALQDAVQKLLKFAGGGPGHQTGLQAEINQLKKSVPDVFMNPTAKAAKPTAAPAASPPSASSGAGLLSDASLLFTKLRDLRSVGQLGDSTTQVSDLARQLQTPLRAKLREDIQQGRSLAAQPVPQDPSQAEAIRQNLASLTAQFKQFSNITIPLTQEILVLDECRANLREWQNSIHRECFRILKVVLGRVIAVLIGLGLVLVISRLWRHATFRYIRDARRRHQLLLVQRVVTGLFMAIVVILGFVSEFSSLATFAGFITAGIAVALQTVILSLAAYTFLVGRYGVRVGDRITVAGVTGDVVDVGIVRLYMMELAGTGADLYPTGRLVVVSNSVLFQSTPFFKQIPGTAHAWHEMAITLAPGSDYALAESKLLEAVNSVYADYGRKIEQQYQTSESLMNSPFSSPRPHAHLQLVENGLDLVIRYPVEIHRESEIDSQMSRKLMELLRSTPDLKTSAASLRIRSAIRA